MSHAWDSVGQLLDSQLPVYYIDLPIVLYTLVSIASLYPREPTQDHLRTTFTTSYKEEFEKRLLQIYDLRILGELSWFLGIRVIRDRPSKSIWLIQDSFINKVASKFNLTSDKGYPDFPIKENVLPPSTEEPNSKRTKIYQQLVGSLAYIATFTRPDVARAHSVLARHLANPGQKHLYAAIHCWRYLIGKRNLALKASGTQNEKDLFVIPVENADKYTDTVEPIFYGASDAAYADEPDTRRSSEGYLFKLYGLSVDWKAAIQKHSPQQSIKWVLEGSDWID
ncbi:hypothetical protein PtrM4_113500 [Pyrenophora tritici-repentis]|uniref:Reverse transcriptase Ty1/copia-type domain-containing protein n=1 Tax=Pyrenophora tritici-repentis TaxID=45151 RepID=A0A834RSE5_9PLEO|nr:hypothetical protein PtrM4_113500 [Pyrenophora tritici-repentis]